MSDLRTFGSMVLEGARYTRTRLRMSRRALGRIVSTFYIPREKRVMQT